MTPDDVFRAWSLQPLTLGGVALAAVCYWLGLRRLWSGGALPGRGVRPWQAWCFAGGLLSVLVALVSPLDAMAGALLSAHMVQHLLLLVVAAPLIVLGAPGLVIGQSLSPSWRARTHAWGRQPALHGPRRILAHPVVAWLVSTAIVWSWHVPALYQAALEQPLIHALEHASMLAAAALFWWVVFAPAGPRHLARGADVVYVFTGALQSGALGALLVFAAQPIYPLYLGRTAPWGLTALQDQQLAGVIMWVPPFLIYLAVAGALFVSWLRATERESLRAEAREAGLKGAPQSARVVR
jgi:putative membrane protein